MNSSTDTAQKPSILVVDDSIAGLQLLVKMLKEKGCEARPVPNGKLALEAAGANLPDLILLDINMPEMDGFEVCRELKKDAQLADVPVIFISGKNETFDKVKAFSTGGVDYVTKPFQLEEVWARIETHINIQRLRKKLEVSNRKLAESLEKQKGLEALRDSLVHMMVHDLKSPLATISLCLQMIQREAGKGLADQLMQEFQMAQSSVNAMIRMVNAILDISRLEEGKLVLKRAECDVASLAREAVRVTGQFREEIKVTVETPSEPLSAYVDTDLIQRVFQNLLDNAYKYSPEGGEIRIAVEVQGERIAASVADSGPGIAEQYHGKIFEKFWQVEAKKQGIPTGSTGLGLAFCKLVLEAHGGRIWVESNEGKGSTFKFVIPKNGANARPVMPDQETRK